jgi:hypothetical protein
MGELRQVWLQEQQEERLPVLVGRFAFLVKQILEDDTAPNPRVSKRVRLVALRARVLILTQEAPVLSRLEKEPEKRRDSVERAAA